ncbi:hypothetical protein [Leptolyngbya sp. FACHB-261]|uniref:hypothetical protein n=1 Tax=Leptolyngbya sp. FACHB-261 TaxID=2692806 RepID=UPI00168372EE|nr:hypothetical protein [Leptolyngbya sp. FACHB-261]MBD2103517.1 hypothetical protein [Leptolyngbya sp. FACHB-261]
MNTFFSGASMILSILALMGSGFTLYQVFDLRQSIDSLEDSVSRAAVAPAPVAVSPTTVSSEPTNSTASSDPATDQSSAEGTATPGAASTAIQPGQFVQSAFGTKARVELLSAKRIKDPASGNRDVVNVQMRIRREAEDVVGSDMLNVGSTKAVNPGTSETYDPVDFLKRSTGPVSLFSMRQGASADAYVWLRIPEGVSQIDLFVPQTGAFKAVPISE